MTRRLATPCLALLLCLPLALRASDIKDLEKDLKAAFKSREAAQVNAVVTAIVGQGGVEAAGLLLKYVGKMPAGADRYYWTLLNGAAAFTDGAGLGAVGAWVLDNKRRGEARDLLFALRDNASRAYAAALSPVLEDGPYDLQVMVIEHLGELDYAESIDVLLAALQREQDRSADLAERIVGALVAATGESLSPTFSAWEAWWALNRRDDFRRPAGGGSTGTATDVLDPLRETDWGRTKELDPQRIVVVREECEPCNFDHIQQLLERMEVPHTVVTKTEFGDKEFSMKGRIALLLNCTQIKEHCICPTCKPTGDESMRLYECGDCNVHEIVSHAFGDAAVRKIKAFVEAGGYLFSEDWGLPEVLEKAWPAMVKVGDYQKEQEVDVVPSRGMTSHPLLRGVFQKEKDERHKGEGEDEDEGQDDQGTIVVEPDSGTEVPEFDVTHMWTVDNDSPTIKVVGRTVSVLLVSPMLRENAKGLDPVALTFLAGGEKDDVGRRPRTGHGGRGGEGGGKGRVLHVLSHFGKQGDVQDEYALQNLLINFLIEAQRRIPTGVR